MKRNQANKKKSTKKRLTQMNTAELAEATSEFDRELIVESFGPPSEEAKQVWEQAKRKRGRPREGRGAKVVSVSIEKQLLERSDALAKSMGISRAALIARGLLAVLAAQGKTTD